MVGSEQQNITVTVANTVFTFSEAVGAYLVTHEANLWEAAEGWVPPPEEPPEETVLNLTSNYTLGNIAKQVFCNTQGGTFVVKVPSAAGNKGKEYKVVCTATNGNPVTLESFGGEFLGPLLNGGTTMNLGKKEIYATVTIVSDGTNWRAA